MFNMIDKEQINFILKTKYMYPIGIVHMPMGVNNLVRRFIHVCCRSGRCQPVLFKNTK